MMISLQFLCSCTELKVYPNNCTDKNASLKKEWYIYYRFYGLAYRSNPKFKKGKLIIIKRMNQFKTIQERQGNTKLILEQELDKLKKKAYNPITNDCTEIASPQIDISPSTGFMIALTYSAKAWCLMRMFYYWVGIIPNRSWQKECIQI